jgi:hypothetical protein
MKKIIFLLSILLSQKNSAQNFTLTPLEKSVDTKKAPSRVRVLHIDKRQKVYLSSNSRDKVLNNYFKNEINDWDEVDKDIFYKSLINYSNKELKEKYKFLNDDVINKIKNELK